MKKIFVFIGPPGSGKGTQAKKIALKFGYAHISSGDLLRKLLRKKEPTNSEKRALKMMKNGKLVPNYLIYKVVFREILKKMKSHRGVVLDGAIRTSRQARDYEKFFVKNGWGNEVLAIYVVLTNAEAYKRMTKRRICEKCGEIIPWIKQTKKIKVCPKCGGNLVYRKDDHPGIIKKRIAEQGSHALRPIVEYYKSINLLKRVDGSKDIKSVGEDIQKILQEKL